MNPELVPEISKKGTFIVTGESIGNPILQQVELVVYNQMSGRNTQEGHGQVKRPITKSLHHRLPHGSR